MSESVPTQDDEIGLLDLLQVMVDNLRLLVLGPLAAGLTALAISFAVLPTYTARTQFLPPQQQQSAAASMLQTLGTLGGLVGAGAGIKNPADQYIAYLRSVTLQDILIDRFKLQQRYGEKYKVDTRKQLTRNVKVVAGKEGLITLEADDHDPGFAAELANAHIEELGKLLGRLAVTEAQQRRLFFEKQLQRTKDNMIAAEQKLRATGVSDEMLKASPSSAVSVVASLKAQITAQEVKLGNMRSYLAETAPEFRQAMAELSNLRRQLARQQSDEPVQTKTTEGDYIGKYREFKYQETLFELFAKQYEVARVDEAREGAVVQVLDRALPPERKSQPQIGFIASLVVLISGLVLLLFVFMRQALRHANAETARKLSRLLSSCRQALTTR